MNSKNNKLTTINDFDELLKRRVFENHKPGFPEEILAKSKRSIGLNGQANLLPQWSLATYAYASLAIFFLGIIIGFYGVHLPDNFEGYSQHAQILNFLKPYGVVL